MTVTELVKKLATAGKDAFETRDITRLDGVVAWALKEAAKLDAAATSAKTPSVSAGKGRGW